MGYFDILGLPETATLEQIKIKYRQLAKIHHPDMPTGNSEKFRLIHTAYLGAIAIYRKKERAANKCPMCAGSGVLELSSGFRSIKRMCKRCRGRGYLGSV